MAQKSDILIVGGGLSGLTASLILAREGLSVTCLDRFSIADQNKSDERTTAISFGSSKIFEQAGIWDSLEPLGCPIEKIAIKDGGSPTLMDFKKPAPNKPMGWIFENRDLRTIMQKYMEQTANLTYAPHKECTAFKSFEDDVQVQTEDGSEYKAALLIGADGRQSAVRKAYDIESFYKDYSQTALVCMVTHEHPHHNQAVEHFYSDGPFAVLPMNDTHTGKHRSAIVWSFHTKEKMSDKDMAFIKAGLETRLPKRYGQILAVDNIAYYPLTLNHAYQYTAGRMALIADAAHGIHPIAGQGLNLGLQDIGCLTALISQAYKAGHDIGETDLLKQYETTRRPINTQMAIATDSLNSLFASRNPALQIARKIGMMGIERLNPAKGFFIKTAMGLKS